MTGHGELQQHRLEESAKGHRGWQDKGSRNHALVFNPRPEMRARTKPASRAQLQLTSGERRKERPVQGCVIGRTKQDYAKFVQQLLLAVVVIHGLLTIHKQKENSHN